MKSMNRLISGLYADACRLIEQKPDHRDVDYVTARIQNEGLAFLTITLPTFAQGTLASIELGYWDKSRFNSFRTKSSSCLPNFCWGFTSQLFCPKSGVLLDRFDPSILDALLQFTRFFKRVKAPCTEKRRSKAFLEYERVDNEVKLLRDVNKTDATRLRAVFKVLFTRLACSIDKELYEGTLLPRHGSGAVAEKLSSNAKYSAAWFNRLDGSFPPELYISPNLGADFSLEDRSYIEQGSEFPARVTSVPKTAKTPRLIAIEPTCIQYTQQALMQSIYAKLDKGFLKSIFNIRDQSVNQSLVKESSLNRINSTIDLSEASDRVGAGLVSFLFRGSPHLRRALFAARSSSVSLPQGVKRLRKFASMGSAVCFPIEAMVFCTIVTLAMLTEDRLPLTPSNIRRYASRVKVYGDDIIVPTDYAHSVILGLEFFGLKVNRNKTFIRSEFRESCGEDWCRGTRVTSVYLNHWIPGSPRDAEAVVASAHLVSRLWAAGLWSTASLLDAQLGRTFGPFPTVLSTSPCLGVVIPWRSYDEQRVNHTLHRPEVYGFRLKLKEVTDPIEGYNALLKCFLEKLSPRDDVLAHLSAPASHRDLDKALSSRELKLIRGWSAPY